MAAENLIGKITLGTMRVNAKKFIPLNDSDKPFPVARIYGLARSIKAVVDKNRGETFEALSGQFEGVNMDTGELFGSGVCYLPSGIHQMVANAVKNLKEDEDAVKFALEIGVVKASNAAGYSYEARSLVKAESVDPLTDLRNALPGGTPTPQIEAPKKTAGK